MVLEFKVARLHRLNGESVIKAMCDINICDELVVKGFRVVDGKNGLFVGLPQESGKNGKWYDRAFPLNEAVREAINEVVLSAYEDSQNQ